MGDLLLRFSGSYIPVRPEHFPAAVSWPSQHDLVDSLGSIADLKWPYVESTFEQDEKLTCLGYSFRPFYILITPIPSQNKSSQSHH